MPSVTAHKCLNLFMTEAFYCAGGAVSGVSLVNELPEIFGLAAHAEGSAQRCVFNSNGVWRGRV